MSFPWRQWLVITSSLIIGAMVAAFLLGAVRIEKAPTTDYKYALDVATFGLTLVQVLLALLAIGLAALAVVGYSDIRNAAVASAQTHAAKKAEEVAREYLEEWELRQKDKIGVVSVSVAPSASTAPTSVTTTPVERI